MAPGGVQHTGRAVLQGGPEDQRQKDSCNGMPPVPGGRNAVRGGTQATDDGSNAFLPVEAAGSGTVP